MRSMWCESDRDECLSVSLALALPLEQRPKLSFLTPPSTPSLNSLMTFIILAGIQFNLILIIFLFIIYPSLATIGSFPHLSLLSHWVLGWRGFDAPILVCPFFHYFYLGFETHKLGFWDRQQLHFISHPPHPFLALPPSRGSSQSPPEARVCVAESKSPIGFFPNILGFRISYLSLFS